MNSGSVQVAERNLIGQLELTESKLYLQTTPDRDDASWQARLQEYEAVGDVALYHQLDWLRAHRPGRHRLLSAHDPNGQCRCLSVVSISPTRAMPGHRVMRVERFQGGLDPTAERKVLEEIVRWARRTPRLLTAQVRLLHPDTPRRVRWGGDLAENGFVRSDRPRAYTQTVTIDLEPSEAAILASFHRTARRHIRAVGKHPVRIDRISDAALVPRMEALIDETRRRTGGTFATGSLGRLLDMAQRSPERLQLLGLFRTDLAGPDALLAFVVGHLHGNHAEYATAASTRGTDLKLPLSYGLAWELMRWAKASGAKWFDFGGITAGTHGDTKDALGGISDFKRYFSTKVVDIADEWVLQPSPLRARFATIARSIVRRNQLLR